MKRRAAALALCGLTLAGCASDEPIVDLKGVDQQRYAQDVAECREIADQVGVGGSAAGGGALGALGGAAVGAAIGAVTGNPGRGASIGAAGGGTGGVIKGTQRGYDKQERVLRNCLKGRGYKVLD